MGRGVGKWVASEGEGIRDNVSWGADLALILREVFLGGYDVYERGIHDKLSGGKVRQGIVGLGLG